MQHGGSDSTLRRRILDLTHSARQAETALAHGGGADEDARASAQQVVDALSECIADVRGLAAKRNGANVFKLQNLPTWPKPRVTAWLKRQKVEVTEVEKESEWRHAVITVATSDIKAAAMQRLASCQIQGSHLQCSELVATGAPAVTLGSALDIGSRAHGGAAISKRAIAAPADAARPAKQSKMETPKDRDPDFPEHEKLYDIREQLTPLWRLTYAPQLQEKFASMAAVLEGLSWNLARRIGDEKRPQWLHETLSGSQKSQHLCCPLLGIMRSPAQNAYRNNVEFSIGFSPDGKPTVGYLYGRFADGFTEIADPRSMSNISAVGKGYAALLTAFLRSEHSNLAAWNKADTVGPVERRGFWRLLCVREGRRHTFFPPSADAADNRDDLRSLATLNLDRFLLPAAQADGGPSELQADALAHVSKSQADAPPPDDVVLLLQVNDKFASASEASAELEAFTTYLRNNRPAELPEPTVCVVQEHSLSGNGAPPDAPLRGAPGFESASTTFNDTLCDVTFKLRPTSFFQVNSAAAACLYKLAGEWSAPGRDAVLLDLYCGCGSFGITLAHRVRQVIGIDNNAASIASATEVATANGLANCEFIAAAVEARLQEVLHRPDVRKAEEVVAIVDPPRGGLLKGAIYALLGQPRISRVVYVSCCPETLQRDVVDLTIPARSVRRPHTGTRTQGAYKTPKEPPRQYVPFEPVKSMALDLFPHTRHVEAIMVLERPKGTTA